MSNSPSSPSTPQEIALHLMLERYPFGYVRLDEELRVEEVSFNFTELIGCQDVDLSNRPLLTELCWAFVGAEQALRQVLAGQEAEFRLQRINFEDEQGNLRYFDYSVHRRQDLATQKPYLFLLIEDRTSICLLEQQMVQERNDLRLAQGRLANANMALQKLNQLKNVFLSVAAHDLRSPLTSVGLYAELLQSKLPQQYPQEFPQYLSIIISQVDLMARLIGDLLDFDQIEQGSLSVSLKPCDLNEIAHKVGIIKNEAATWESKSVILETTGVINPVLADAERVEQILHNLLTNAIKYTQSGGQIWLRTRRSDSYGIVEVQDTGCGIAPEELDRLFQLYYRTQDARQSQVRGVGLGLFIVKSLVDAMNGRVSIDSELGKGTRVILELPAA